MSDAAIGFWAGVGFGVVLIVLRALFRRDASGDQWETEGRE